jgi:hypothetical protein
MKKAQPRAKKAVILYKGGIVSVLEIYRNYRKNELIVNNNSGDS